MIRLPEFDLTHFLEIARRCYNIHAEDWEINHFHLLSYYDSCFVRETRNLSKTYLSGNSGALLLHKYSHINTKVCQMGAGECYYGAEYK